MVGSFRGSLGQWLDSVLPAPVPARRRRCHWRRGRRVSARLCRRPGPPARRGIRCRRCAPAACSCSRSPGRGAAGVALGGDPAQALPLVGAACRYQRARGRVCERGGATCTASGRARTGPFFQRFSGLSAIRKSANSYILCSWRMARLYCASMAPSPWTARTSCA